MSNFLEVAGAYRALELEIGSPLEEVLRQHRQMVARHRPSQSSAHSERDSRTAEGRLQEINTAKEVLVNYLQHNNRGNGDAFRHAQQQSGSRSTEQQGFAHSSRANDRLGSGLQRFMNAAEDLIMRKLPDTQPQFNLAEAGWPQEYEVRGRNIGDSEFADLLSSPDLLRVRRLRLCNTMITDAGVIPLLNLPFLEHLDLHECPNITSRVFMTLLECRALKRVCIRGCRITQADSQSFARLRPDCEVRYMRRSCP